MRIIIVSDFGSVTGGAAKVAITSARGLADAGHEVVFVCAMRPLAPELTHPRIAVHCLGFDSVWSHGNPISAATQGIWNGAASAALETILDGFDARETVVHIHQWTKALSPSVLTAAARKGYAAAVTLHDYFLACPNGAYYRYRAATPCTSVPMSASCLLSSCDSRSRAHKTVRIFRQYATQRAIARAGASLSIISVSAFAERVIAPFLPTAHARYVVPSPIAVERATPAAVAGHRGFVYVGRLTDEKGVSLLAKTATQARVPLTIVGDGPLLPALRALGADIHCTGWLDDAGTAAAIRQARALVFPSTWYETGGLVVLEALARGVPAIVAERTAAADLIEDGVNGFLIDPRDPALLTARMAELSNDSRAAQMGAEAYRRYWNQPRTVESHIVQLLTVYNDMLSRRAKTRHAA